MKSPQTLSWEVLNNCSKKKAQEQISFLWATVLSSYLNQSKCSLASLYICLHPASIIQCWQLIHTGLVTNNTITCSWNLSNTHVLSIGLNRIHYALEILDRTIFITLECHLSRKHQEKLFMWEAWPKQIEENSCSHMRAETGPISPHGTQEKMCMSTANNLHPSAQGCKWPTRSHVVLGLQRDVQE